MNILFILLQYLWVHRSFSHASLENFWCYPSSLTLIFYAPDLLVGFLTSKERGFMETSHLRMNIPNCLTVSINMTISFYTFPSNCKQKFLWWWFNKALIYEYRRMYLGFTFIIRFFFLVDQCHLLWSWFTVLSNPVLLFFNVNIRKHVNTLLVVHITFTVVIK